MFLSGGVNMEIDVSVEKDSNAGRAVVMNPVTGIIRSVCVTFLLCFTFAVRSEAYTVVQPNSATPPGTEAAWVAFSSSTASPYLFTVVPNPFFPNTWNMTLLGPNLAYSPPVTATQMLNAVVQTSTYNYVYGFGGGMIYQNGVDSNLAASYGINCSTPTAFTLTQTSTATFDPATCNDVVGSILQALYQVSLSTPPVLPFEP